MPTSTRFQRAFTVIEMLVAISVTVLLMTMIFQLFSNTQRAVSLGIKSGEMMVESESVGDLMRRDFDNMVASWDSGDPGFLVIAFDEIDGQIRRRNQSAVAETVRSDQIAFIRKPMDNRNSIRALTPEAPDSLSSDVEADYARVWYGHAMRTMPDGTLPAGASLADQDQPNEWINDWVLGRQALLLTDAPGLVYAETAEWDAAIEPTSYGLGSMQLYQGVTDVADQELGDVIAQIESDETAGMSYLEASTPFAISDERPRVNPDPDADYFEPWRIAQMHMHLSGKVGEFIVEFAGDYDDPATGNAGPDGDINKDGDVNIIWYTHDNPDFVNVPGEPDYDPSRPASYPIPAGVGEYDPTEGMIAFRHDDYDAANPDDTDWPYLIRVRYRSFDAAGRVGGYNDAGERTYGQWFEHVMRVRRP